MPKPQRADGRETRARILNAAGALIAAHGFAETRSTRIAAAARVDMASINYHFGTRSGLYRAVLIEAHRRLIARADIERMVRTGQPAQDTLRGLIEFIVASGTGKNRWPVLVLFRELVAPGPNIEALRDQEILPKLHLVIPVLSEITGIPATASVLWACLPCIGAPCLALLLLGDHLQPPDGVAAFPREALAQHLYTFVLGGLKQVGRDFERTSKTP